MQGETCKAHLTELGVRYAPATLQDRIAAPITVDDMTFGGVTYASLFRKGPFVLDCHLAVDRGLGGQPFPTVLVEVDVQLREERSHRLLALLQGQ